MKREAVLVPCGEDYPRGKLCGVRIREQERCFVFWRKWGEWRTLVERGPYGTQSWEESRARALLDAAVDLGVVPDGCGNVLPILAREESC